MNGRAHGFVDGGYLRSLARSAKVPLPNPRDLVVKVLMIGGGYFPPAGSHAGRIALVRTTYYDAKPEVSDEVATDIRDYWNAIEVLDDTELGFGSLKGGGPRREPRQKGVDTLIAVDMLVGAYNKIFTAAVLLSGDADFVPVVQEVRRCGVTVILGAHESSLSDDLRRAVDRFVAIGPGVKQDGLDLFVPLTVGGRTWRV